MLFGRRFFLTYVPLLKTVYIYSGIARGVEKVIVLELIEWCMQYSSI